MPILIKSGGNGRNKKQEEVWIQKKIVFPPVSGAIISQDTSSNFEIVAIATNGSPAIKVFEARPNNTWVAGTIVFDDWTGGSNVCVSSDGKTILSSKPGSFALWDRDENGVYQRTYGINTGGINTGSLNIAVLAKNGNAIGLGLSAGHYLTGAHMGIVARSSIGSEWHEHPTLGVTGVKFSVANILLSYDAKKVIVSSSSGTSLTCLEYEDDPMDNSYFTAFTFKDTFQAFSQMLNYAGDRLACANDYAPRSALFERASDGTWVQKVVDWSPIGGSGKDPTTAISGNGEMIAMASGSPPILDLYRLSGTVSKIMCSNPSEMSNRTPDPIFSGDGKKLLTKRLYDTAGISFEYFEKI